MGGPRDSFGGPLGVQMGQGGSWGALEKIIFCFVGRGGCQSSNEILMFSVWGRFVKRSVVPALYYCLIVFRSLLFAKQ